MAYSRLTFLFHTRMQKKATGFQCLSLRMNSKSLVLKYSCQYFLYGFYSFPSHFYYAWAQFFHFQSRLTNGFFPKGQTAEFKSHGGPGCLTNVPAGYLPWRSLPLTEESSAALHYPLHSTKRFRAKDPKFHRHASRPHTASAQSTPDAGTFRQKPPSIKSRGLWELGGKCEENSLLFPLCHWRIIEKRERVKCRFSGLYIKSPFIRW